MERIDIEGERGEGNVEGFLLAAKFVNKVKLGFLQADDADGAAPISCQCLHAWCILRSSPAICSGSVNAIKVAGRLLLLPQHSWLQRGSVLRLSLPP